jgi:nucleoside 2-deoxyribosyltransferase
MRVFLGGVMQGSRQDRAIDDQSYRQVIARTVRARHPAAEIVDPQALFPDSPAYDDERARQVFFNMVEAAARADVVVAYLPEASMGTAMEMVRAYDAGKPVVSISPMEANWFVRFLSRHTFPTLEAFIEWVEEGGLQALISPKTSATPRSGAPQLSRPMSKRSGRADGLEEI